MALPSSESMACHDDRSLRAGADCGLFKTSSGERPCLRYGRAAGRAGGTSERDGLALRCCSSSVAYALACVSTGRDGTETVIAGSGEAAALGMDCGVHAGRRAAKTACWLAGSHRPRR